MAALQNCQRSRVRQTVLCYVSIKTLITLRVTLLFNICANAKPINCECHPRDIKSITISLHHQLWFAHNRINVFCFAPIEQSHSKEIKVNLGKNILKLYSIGKKCFKFFYYVTQDFGQHQNTYFKLTEMLISKQFFSNIFIVYFKLEVFRFCFYCIQL